MQRRERTGGGVDQREEAIWGAGREELAWVALTDWVGCVWAMNVRMVRGGVERQNKEEPKG